MGLNVGSLYSANQPRPVIDTQALQRVTEQILNPKEQTVDVSKLDLSKFNRPQMGTDLYAARTNGEVALQVAKTAADFDLNLSNAFSAKVQYLNSQAAQSLFTSKERNGQLTVSVEAAKQDAENEIVLASSKVVETTNTNKDKKGSNPFAFYFKVDKEDGEENETPASKSINIFA